MSEDLNSLRRTFTLVCAVVLGAGAGGAYRSATQPLNPVKEAVTVELKGYEAVNAIKQKVAAGKDIPAAEVQQLTAYNDSVNNNKEALAMILAGGTGLLFMGATGGRKQKAPGA